MKYYVLLLFFLLPCGLFADYSHKNHKVVVLKNWKPYYFVEKGQPQGYAIDVFEKIAKNIDLKYEYIIAKNWSEATQLLEEGQLTIMPNMGITPKRENIVSFTQPTDVFEIQLYKKASDNYLNSFDDIKKRKIAVVKNNVCNQLISTEESDFKIIYKSYHQAFSHLIEGKVDTLCYPKPLVQYTLKELDIDTIVPYGTPLRNIQRGIGVTKDAQYLLEDLNQEVLRLKANGELAKIYAKWFLKKDGVNLSYEQLIIFLALIVILFVIILYYLKSKKWLLTQSQLQEIIDEQTQLLKEKNMQLVESKRLLESVLNENPNPIVIKNYEGKFVLVNQAVAKLYNSTPEVMVGKDDGDFIDDKQMVEFFRQNVRKIMDKGKSEIVYEDSRDAKTNEVRHYMSIKTPFLNEQGEKHILVIANDITEVRQLEEEQLKNQKMLLTQSKIAAVGEMLGNISHQWRQPLSTITTSMSGLKLSLEYKESVDKDEVIACSDDVMKQAKYLSKTIDDFREFFISDSEEKGVYELNSVFMKLKGLVQNVFENNFIKMDFNIEKDISIVLNESILLQALINICNNAKDAILENIKESEKRCFCVELRKEGANVVITFQDSGGGIDDEILSKIFEPYFTTKHPSVGTGIGLYMTHEIVTKHLKGTIEVYNKDFEYDGKMLRGAHFKITLPIHARM